MSLLAIKGVYENEQIILAETAESFNPTAISDAENKRFCRKYL